MTLVILSLIHAVVATVAAPLILTRGTWQVWHPRWALACWHLALASGVGALLFSVLWSLVLAQAHGTHGNGSLSTVLALGSWIAAFVFAAFCALMLGRTEPVLRRERGVSDHLRYAAMTCRQWVEEREGTLIRYVETDQPLAYSFHAPEPTVVLGTVLRRELSAAELDAVIAHERAHLREHHHLALRLAHLNTACLPSFAPARRLQTSTRFLVELIADDVAARDCGVDSTRAALLAMGRLADNPELRVRAERLRTGAPAIGGTRRMLGRI